MLKEWLGKIPFSDFRESYFRKQPFSLPNEAARYIPVMTWNRLDTLVAKRPQPDMLVVKEGELWPGEPPGTALEAKAFHSKGYSLVLRNTELHDAGLAVLAAEVGRELDGNVAIQVYATPGGHYSFTWHYDAEEVFILQTAGKKDYFLRENTINPHPKLTAMPKDMQYEKETSPTMAVTLIPGDWLYIPGGWWHVAKAPEPALSISIGLLPR